jgi:hypothetical protein
MVFLGATDFLGLGELDGSTPAMSAEVGVGLGVAFGEAVAVATTSGARVGSASLS